MHHLAARVYAGVRAPGHRDTHRLAYQTLQRLLKESLDAAKARLRSPANKVGSVVRQIDSDSQHSPILAYPAPGQ